MDKLNYLEAYDELSLLIERVDGVGRVVLNNETRHAVSDMSEAVLRDIMIENVWLLRPAAQKLLAAMKAELEGEEVSHDG